MPGSLYQFVGLPGWTIESVAFAIGCAILWILTRYALPVEVDQ